jgi:hypothetical protein
MWSTMGVWMGKSCQMTEEDVKFVSEGIASNDVGALTCLHTACYNAKELLSNCSNLQSKLTTIVEEAGK